MNFLFHMLLSGADQQVMVGNFMGDFVKGPLADRFPERIRHGVTLHRRIDSFAAGNEFFRRSRNRLDPGYRLYRGVLVDLFYDHFLVNEWNEWTNEPIASYLTRTRAVIEGHLAELPERMQPLVPYIFDEMLPSYGEVKGISHALERMSRRIVRPNPLAGGEVELVRHYNGLHEDFQRFMPQVRDFAFSCMSALTA